MVDRPALVADTTRLADALTDAGPAAAAEVCRLTVVGNDRRMDLTVPDHIPLVELLPVLFGHLDAGAGAEHDGWVFQRLGDAPLDEEKDLATLGIRDGDVLYLRPRTGPLRPVVFDDLVDGIAVGIAARSDRWSPAYTQRIFLVLMVVAPFAGFVLLLRGGSTGPRAAVAVTAAVVLLLAASVAARGLGEHVAGWCWAHLAVGYAALAGWLAPAALGSAPGGASGLVSAGAGAVCAALFAVIAVGGSALALTPIVIVGANLLAAGLLRLAVGVSAAGAAAVFVVVALIVGLLAPRLASWLAHVRVAPPPANVAELLDNVEPLAADDVLARAALADRFLAAGYAGAGAVAAVCFGFLAFAAGWAPPTVCVAGCAVLLLHSRVIGGATQRIVVITPAVLGLTFYAIRFFDDLRSPEGFVVGVLVALIGSGLLFAAARTLPGQPVLPLWGRIGDIAEAVLAATIIPLALIPTGVFGAVRGLGG